MRNKTQTMSDISNDNRHITIKMQLRSSLNIIKRLSIYRISQNNIKKYGGMFKINEMDFKNIRLAIYDDILSRNPKPVIGVHIENSGNTGYKLHANQHSGATLAYISNNRTYRYGPEEHQYAMCLFDMDDLSLYCIRRKEQS